MYGDLNIPFSSNQSLLNQYINRVKELGYKFIAINNTVSGGLQPKHKNTSINNNSLNTSFLNFGDNNFKIFSRLTAVLDSPNQVHSLNPSSPIIKSYDIIAVQPMTEKLFQQAVSSPLEVDIIVLAQNTRQPFSLRVPTIKLALERGIHFEICYSYLIGDNESSTRFLMANALNLIRVTKGKNIIFTSGANSQYEFRSPFDVASLGHLFGLNYQSAQNALSINCFTVLHHAYARTTYKGVVEGKKLSELDETEKWKIPTNEELPKVGEKRKRDLIE